MSDDTSGWDEFASGWDENPGARAYAAAAYESLTEVLADRHHQLGGARVLDFGCGTGLLTDQMAEHAVSIDAVDTSEAMLDVLREKIDRRGWTHVHPMTDLPTGRSRYDLVVASSVCSFLDDYPATARQLVALLRPDGVFVQWDWEADENEVDSGGLSRSTVSNSLAAVGLEQVVVETAFSVAVDGDRMEPLIGVGTKTRSATP